MSSRLRYHLFMPWRSPVVVLALVLVVVSALQAQIHGTPASVTSLGGSHTFFNPPGVPASVTSLGPMGYTPFRGSRCCFNFDGRSFDNRRNPHHGLGKAIYPYGGYPLYYMPYYVGYGDVVNPVDDSMEQAYDAMSDRQAISQSSALQQQYDDRISRLEEQIDQLESASHKSEPAKPSAAAETPAAPVRAPPVTILVFRDGHSVSVKDYAIMGDTIYDFSSGSGHKIALADLDIPATQKKNEDRGLDFRLPARPVGN